MDSLAESVIGKGRIIMNSEFCIAVHGLVFLKLKKQCLSSEALAENICTNPARVRKVMAKLKKAGLVSTKEGSEGGYSLAKNAQQITLKQISAALQIVDAQHLPRIDGHGIVVGGRTDGETQVGLVGDQIGRASCRERV